MIVFYRQHGKISHSLLLVRIFKHSASKKLCSRDTDLASLEATLEAFLGE